MSASKPAKRARPKVSYEPVDGARLKKKDAEAVAKEFTAIHRAAGVVSQELIVQRAADPGSPIHHLFQWDDSEAARLYRLEQARCLLRSVRVVYTSPNKEPIKTRAFVRAAAPSDEGGNLHFQPTMVLMKDGGQRAALVRRAWQELQSWRKRHASLTEFAEVFSAMDLMETQERKAA